MIKKTSKKIWVFIVFSVFVAVAMAFVSWLVYVVFAENYCDIKRQSYAVVSEQVIDNIENSIKNGKEMKKFYGIKSILDNMLFLVNSDSVKAQTAIVDKEGTILYTSYDMDENKSCMTQL